MGEIISLVISTIYLVLAYIIGGGWLLLKTLLFLLLPLACVWFSESMGSYTAPLFGIRPYITKESPGCFVAFAGWILLTLPLVLFIVFRVRM